MLEIPLWGQTLAVFGGIRPLPDWDHQRKPPKGTSCTGCTYFFSHCWPLYTILRSGCAWTWEHRNKPKIKEKWHTIISRMCGWEHRRETDCYCGVCAVSPRRFCAAHSNREPPGNRRRAVVFPITTVAPVSRILRVVHGSRGRCDHPLHCAFDATVRQNEWQCAVLLWALNVFIIKTITL